MRRDDLIVAQQATDARDAAKDIRSLPAAE